jgi:hypothetical protein
VVAENLVQLDEIRSPFLEPVRESLVEIGANTFR